LAAETISRPCVSFAQSLELIDTFSHRAKVFVCDLLRLARENFFDVGLHGDAAGLGKLG
jgi:hypothetical protein